MGENEGKMIDNVTQSPTEGTIDRRRHDRNSGGRTLVSGSEIVEPW